MPREIPTPPPSVAGEATPCPPEHRVGVLCGATPGGAICDERLHTYDTRSHEECCPRCGRLTGRVSVPMTALAHPLEAWVDELERAVIARQGVLAAFNAGNMSFKAVTAAELRVRCARQRLLRGGASPAVVTPDGVDRRCGSQGVDAEGHCTRCGLEAPDPAETLEVECPPGFFDPATSTAAPVAAPAARAVTLIDVMRGCSADQVRGAAAALAAELADEATDDLDARLYVTAGDLATVLAALAAADATRDRDSA